jgi:hypothetical protein
MDSRRFRWFGVALLLMSPKGAWAQRGESASAPVVEKTGSPVPEPSPAERATARKLAEDAYFALARRDYATAVDYYTRALALVHAPTLLRDLARAQVGLGLLVEAHENYSSILREGVEVGAPEPFRDALDDAQREIEPLAARLPWVTLSVTGAPAAELRVSIDGQSVSAATLDVKRAINPGRHEIRASAPGYETATRSLVIQEGESVQLGLSLQALAASPASTRNSGLAMVSMSGPAWRKPAAIGAFSLGGAGLALGGVAGVLALQKHNQLAHDCPGSVCDPALSGERSQYHRWGLISTLGFAAGGVGVGSGVVLLLIEPSAARDDRAGVVVAPYCGLGEGGLKGSF